MSQPTFANPQWLAVNLRYTVERLIFTPAKRRVWSPLSCAYYLKHRSVETKNMTDMMLYRDYLSGGSSRVKGHCFSSVPRELLCLLRMKPLLELYITHFSSRIK